MTEYATQRYETAAAVATRARVANAGFGLMANGTWSIRSCSVVPTGHKHVPLRRPTVIPT